jgi:hypothetical protein
MGAKDEEISKKGLQGRIPFALKRLNRDKLPVTGSLQGHGLPYPRVSVPQNAEGTASRTPATGRLKGFGDKADTTLWGNSRWGQRHHADPSRGEMCVWKMYD